MALKNLRDRRALLIILFTFLLFLGLKSQQKEAFINYNEKYIKSLGETHDIDESLHIDSFRERFYFLNANTPLSIDYNDITYTYVKKYLSYKWYGKIIGLSTYYFPLFEKKLAQYGMPLELKYLAVVESALNPRAGSWAGAKGLWQFMPTTGSQYGIKKNDYINIYYDPVGNTDSAVRYLKDLYVGLGDWNLAISAYNCGAGNVRKAIRKAGSKNYWKVRPFLPKETQAYVPSFIAVNYMFNFYKNHNIHPNYFKYSFLDLKLIKTSRNTTFQELYKLYDPNLLKFSNPQFMTNYIPKGSIIYVSSKN